MCLIRVLGISSGGGHGNTLRYCCLENPHGQRSLVGYSPWDHNKLDIKEQLTLSLSFIYSYIKVLCISTYILESAFNLLKKLLKFF